jgi:hypothetical protein
MAVIIRPASIDPPPLRIGSVDGGYAARALARYAAIHSAERPPHMGACANARSARVPAIVPDQKTKAAAAKNPACDGGIIRHTLPFLPKQVEGSRPTYFLKLNLTSGAAQTRLGSRLTR